MNVEVDKDSEQVLRCNDTKAPEQYEGLLRLFESSVFDMDLAIQYLSKCNDYGVQAFLVNKFFSYEKSFVDFFLPQLVCLYVCRSNLSDILQIYFNNRCNESVEYTMSLVWMIDSYIYSSESVLSNEISNISYFYTQAPCNYEHVIKFRNSLIAGMAKMHNDKLEVAKKSSPTQYFSRIPKSHKRSTSDLSGMSLSRCQLPSQDISDFKKDFFISDQDSIDEDEVVFDDKTFNNSSFHRCSTISQSINSLPDLLSGHAFENVCYVCQQRSFSDLRGQRHFGNFRPPSTLSLPNASKLFLDNGNENAFNNGFVNSPDLTNSKHRHLKNHCSCSSFFIEPQWNFIKTLVSISKRLMRYPSKEQKTNHLRADLAQMNLNLPARVWIPLQGANHYVVRIPPNASVCLNSKNRAPYLIYVEVIYCGSPFYDDLIPKKQNTVEQTSSSSFQRLSTHDVDCSSPNGFVKKFLENEKLEILNFESETFVAAGDIRRRLSASISNQDHQDIPNSRDDPSACVLFEPWSKKRQRIRDSSPYGKIENWDLLPVIVKYGDDLRQEQLAYQVLKMLQKIWKIERTPLWLRPLKVVVLSSESGMIEPVLDAVSIHQIKQLYSGKSLCDYFTNQFGSCNCESFLNARKNFVESCAAYSLVCYLLQVKDRHNGNILLDNEGHMIHIDYGFILSASPGRNLGFEFSPFKLTHEEVEVMGGIQSDMFEYFKILILQGLLAARKHMDKILTLLEILESVAYKFPCFSKGFDTVISNVRDRFHLPKTEEQLQRLVESMVENSLYSLTTRLYDSYQYFTNGIR